MTKEQIVEKIKLEYQLYEVSEVYSLEEVLQTISHFRDEVDSVLGTTSKILEKNKRDAFFARILGGFRSEFGYFAPEVYEKDNELISLESYMLWEYRRCFDRIMYFTNEDNYGELHRLANFTFDSYRKNHSSMEKSRSMALEDKHKLVGVVLSAPLDKDSFYMFFDSTMDEIRGTNNLEFSKKWWSFE